jgi:5-methylthioribose kinase
MLEGEKAQLETTNAIISDSFHALSKKTGVEKKCEELTSRLAISEAELMKMRKKYEVVSEEHKLLRESYTQLEAKASQNEYSIREKLAYAKKNEKELTFFLNKILDEKKGFVSAEVHRAVLGRSQSLKDRSVNAAMKET